MNEMTIIVAVEAAILAGLYYWNKNQKNSFKPLSISATVPAELTDLDKENEELCWSYLEDIYKSWGKLNVEGRNEYRLPDSKEDIVTSNALFDKIRALEPTNPDIVNRANELGKVINDSEKRVFQGSKKLLRTSLFFSVIAFFMASDFNGTEGRFFSSSYFWFFGGLYYFASMTPVWLAEKKKYTGEITSFLYKLTDFSMFDTKTKWKDNYGNNLGTTYNNTGSWITYFFWLMIFCINLMLLPLRVSVNVLRNYILLK